jgi:hypothetical protein
VRVYTAVPNPQMPQLTATIVNQSNVPVSSGTATWAVNSSFSYYTRVTQTAIPSLANPPELNSAPPTTQSSSPLQATWTTSFGSIFGGNAEIDWTYTAPGGSAQAGNPFHFPICGQNPDFTTAGTALAASSPSGNQYWFAPYIANHETNMSQFCDTTGNTSGESYCQMNSQQPSALGLPILGGGAGYGMMQLDPVPNPPPNGTSDALWNWQTNIKAGLALLDTKAASAYPFWIRQVQQWQLWNSQNPPVDPPSETRASCTFLAVDGNGNPLPASQTNPYWYGDAILMGYYAGLDPQPNNPSPSPAYMSWLNSGVYTANPVWSYNRTKTYQGVAHNPFYEFCTCTTQGSSCQHTTPSNQF